MVLGLWMLLMGCGGRSAPAGLTAEQARAYVRDDAPTPERWASATVSALRDAGQVPTPDTVCQVFAVIEQESGYDPSPSVPGLGPMALAALEQEVESTLGLLAGPTLAEILDATPAGASASFRAQLREVRTEEALDRWYRGLVDHHRGRVPGAEMALKVVFPRLEERLHPVATVGSMQVSAQWAQDHPLARGLPREVVRDQLYTVEGGVRFGTLRLFATADYPEPIHRFADFNAGPHASRNAAFQEAVAELSGASLQLDGDLLRWNDRGRPRRRQDGETATALVGLAPELGLDAERILRDLRLEKEVAFEATATWAAVRARYASAKGHPPALARVPEVVLDSPKLSGTWTTETFAERTERRYRSCLARGQ